MKEAPGVVLLRAFPHQGILQDIPACQNTLTIFSFNHFFSDRGMVKITSYDFFL